MNSIETRLDQSNQGGANIFGPFLFCIDGFCVSNGSKVNNGKNVCIVRESNPGRPRGRRAFYH